MINSHYVPRLILRRFNDKLSLYNVKTGELREDIAVSHAYAADNYYDKETENNLNLKIESQFGGFLANYILKQDNEITLSRDKVLLIKKFLLVSLMRVYDEAFIEKERNFYNRPCFQVPFEELDAKDETNYSYWIRTLNVILETNGTPNEILLHPQKTYPAYRWSYLMNNAYLAFWDTPKGEDEFVITDIGMTSENENGWDGIYVYNTKKTGYLNNILMLAKKSNLSKEILQKVYYDCDAQNNFSENFMMFPISSTRMIVLISPFFKLREQYCDWGIKPPELNDLTKIPNPKLFEPNKNYYRLKQESGILHQYHEDDRYIYEIKVLTDSEVQYCNSLFMDRIDTYLGFSSLDKAVNSIIRYKLLNSYPYVPRVNYSKLYKEIEERYGYKLFL